MLPTSHHALIEAAKESSVSGRCFLKESDLNHERVAHAKGSKETFVDVAEFDLAEAFSDFISTSSRLENSYRELQEEVSALRLELEARNAALKTSQAANDRMTFALQQIVDSMPCGVLVVKKDGTIALINPECTWVLGLGSRRAAHDAPLTLKNICMESGMNLTSLSETQSDSEAPHELCIRMLAENRWVEVRKRQLYEQPGGAGKAEQTILIFRDITAQKRAEGERESGRKAMALAEIATTLAHEIRNPLASLELFAQMIENDPCRMREWVSSLKAGVRSLSGTVNNVLTFHGSGTLALTPIIPNDVVSDAIQFAQPLADQAEVSLQWAGHPTAGLIMGNANGIQQVILNLIANALRHTPPKGSIVITSEIRAVSCNPEEATKQRECFIVEVSDTGCGIREDQVDQIFTAGFSGNNDRTGLGLAVCARIMKQHGGNISASKNLRHGAHFSLRFPTLLTEEA